jgi:hypothetical protein
MIGTPDDGRVIAIALQDVHLGLGDGEKEFVSVTDGEGVLLILPEGVAGRFAATVTINIPNVEFRGTFGVTVNATPNAIPATRFDVGGGEITLGHPGRWSLHPSRRWRRRDRQFGPSSWKLRGQTLSGNFSFEQLTTAGNKKLVRVAANRIAMFFGDAGGPVQPTILVNIELANSHGSLLVTPQGMAGEIEGTVSLTPALASQIDHRCDHVEAAVINRLGIAVNETFPRGWLDQRSTCRVGRISAQRRPPISSSMA